jgi:hypothetical protein
MQESIPFKRWRRKGVDIVVAIIATVPIALIIALVLELLALCYGALIGNFDWHRGPVDGLWTIFGKLQKFLLLVEVTAPDISSALPSLLPSQTFMRDLFKISVILFVPFLVIGRWFTRLFMARYDDEALRAAPTTDVGMQWAGSLGEQQEAAWSWLQARCFKGAGIGRSPALLPWETPTITPFSVVVLTGVNGVGKSHLAEAFSRHIDGSTRLEKLPGSWARWRVSLCVRVHGCMWWRARQEADPWDCGYLVEDSTARGMLPHFLPRRATLLIADELLPATLLDCISRLSERRTKFRNPVRLLVIDTALPASLGLVRDGDSGTWSTAVNDLGEVEVMDLSAVQFGVPQFRGLVYAQQYKVNGEQMHLSGQDSQWGPLVDALDGQPILLAEACRLVQESGTTFDNLMREEDPHEKLIARQLKRPITKLPTDVYGITRELLRERVLVPRAEHRKTSINNALGTNNINDESFQALLVASIANGCNANHLKNLLGWKTQRLTPEILSQVFASSAARDDGINVEDRVPAIKPAVIADELLRKCFKAPRDMPLSDNDTRVDITNMVRNAWLLNPAGTLRTLARWQRQSRHDEFTQAMLKLPTLAELETTDTTLSPETRIEMVRAFWELAILNQGDLEQAGLAMAALDDKDLKKVQLSLVALIKRPEAWGLPAMLLWLKLMFRIWPRGQGITDKQAQDFGRKLLQDARHLLQQSVVYWMSSTPMLQQQIADAFIELLPLFESIARPCSEDAVFRSAADDLYFFPLPIEVDGIKTPIFSLRSQLAEIVATSLTGGQAQTIGEPAQWAYAVMCSLVQSQNANTQDPSLDSWIYQEPEALVSEDRLAFVWGQARCLTLVISLYPSAVEAACDRIVAIAREFPNHEGILYEYASAGANLSSIFIIEGVENISANTEFVVTIGTLFATNMYFQRLSAQVLHHLVVAHMKNGSLAEAEVAAERIAVIAKRFEMEEYIQYFSARSWVAVLNPTFNSNAVNIEAGAEKVSKIAKACPMSDLIQIESAHAWTFLAFALRTISATRTKEAADKVSAIARKFPGLKFIQWMAAEAWQSTAFAYSESDASSTKVAAEQVAAIAKEFPTDIPIQIASAKAWRDLAFASGALRNDASAIEAAAKKVAAIASKFLQLDAIQEPSIEAWSLLANALKDSDATKTEDLAKKIATIAKEFPKNEYIQFYRAAAWRYVVWAYRNSNAEASEAAAKFVAAIAEEFLTNVPMQAQKAEAWKFVAFAQGQRGNTVATEAAANVIALVAKDNLGHRDIHFHSAQAWQYLAETHSSSSAASTEVACERVAAIAKDFGLDEEIQYECAVAWRFLSGSAVKFSDRARMDFALAKLDGLCHEQKEGVLSWKVGTVFPRVWAERDSARIMVKSWRLKHDDPAVDG